MLTCWGVLVSTLTVATVFLLTTEASPVLTEEKMELFKTAGELSVLAFSENPTEEAHDELLFFDDEPDQALFLQKMGYCFGVFRGTTVDFDDWVQNFDLRKRDVCNELTVDEPQCCSTRSGFYDAYDTNYRSQMEEAIRDCASSCAKPDECVVLTGFSQGGAIAAVAAVALSDLNPYVITFGQPPAIDAPCPIIASERWYQFINTRARDNAGIRYDPVPFILSFSDFYGQMILLSEDSTGVAYIGQDVRNFSVPVNRWGVSIHSMGEDLSILSGRPGYPGYLDRLENIILTYSNQTYEYPVRSTGFLPGGYCTRNEECQSRECTSKSWKSFLRAGYQCL